MFCQHDVRFRRMLSGACVIDLQSSRCDPSNMRFVIITSRRSGSSHLVNVLGGHPDVLCHGNIFSSGMMPVFLPDGAGNSGRQMSDLKSELKELRDTSPRAFLDRVYGMDHGRAAVGFKIFPHQNDKIMRRLINDDSVRKVVLFRSNVLAIYSSEMAGRLTSQWCVQVGAEQQEPALKVRFDENEFVEFCRQHMEFYSRTLGRLSSKGKSYYLIRYEEVNEPLFLQGLLNFIGADSQKPILDSQQRKKQVKQNSPDVVSRFSNADDVRAFLESKNLLSWGYEGESLIGSWLPDSEPEELVSETAAAM